MVCWYVGLMDLWPSWFCWLGEWLVGSSQAVHFCIRNIRCYGLGVCNVQGWRFFGMVCVCVLGCGLGCGVWWLGLWGVDWWWVVKLGFMVFSFLNIVSDCLIYSSCFSKYLFKMLLILFAPTTDHKNKLTHMSSRGYDIFSFKLRFKYLVFKLIYFWFFIFIFFGFITKHHAYTQFKIYVGRESSRGEVS